MAGTRIDLSGKTFGRLCVLSFSHWVSGNGSYWKCLCDCGTIKVVPGSSLKKGSSKSCGCLNLELKRSRSKSNHPAWKGFEGISGRYIKNTKRGAKIRGLTFSVTAEQMWEKFVEQEGKCALTGKEIGFPVTRDMDDIQRTASIDRINSSHGYTIENIQWVHKDVNKLKQDFEESKFIELCEQVVSYNKANKKIL